jgi:ribosome-binding protein aMBF1 (putative translation factor)
MAKARDYSSEQLRRVQARRDPAQTARTHTRMQLAAKISDAMRASKVSKSQLAAQLDQQPSVVTKWLSGTHNFTVDTLTDIGRVLGINLFSVEVVESDSIQFDTTAIVLRSKVRPSPYQWNSVLRSDEVLHESSIEYKLTTHFDPNEFQKWN